jgi:phosphatidylserine/phosphatidylglycerophosphate/cardiolipin synthase-like enzyme
VTVPTSLHKESRSVGSLSTTKQVFRSILRSATRYVKLCLPFPEEAIASQFSGEISGLARSGVRVKILTREAFGDCKKGFSYGNLVKTLRRIHDIYESCGDRRNIEIRDFHIGLKGQHYERIQYESIHAKIVLADGIRCYVGSGEWRVNSLYNNFEVGVLLGGNAVEKVEQAFNLVWGHARPVTYEFLAGTAHWHNKKTLPAKTRIN